MTYSLAEVQGQRSVGSVDSGNKQTDGDDCITSVANAVGKNVIQTNRLNYRSGLANHLGVQPATQVNSAWPSLRG